MSSTITSCKGCGVVLTRPERTRGGAVFVEGAWWCRTCCADGALSGWQLGSTKRPGDGELAPALEGEQATTEEDPAQLARLNAILNDRDEEISRLSQALTETYEALRSLKQNQEQRGQAEGHEHAELDKLRAERGRSAEEIDDLSKAREVLAEANDELSRQNGELAKQVRELTQQNEQQTTTGKELQARVEDLTLAVDQTVRESQDAREGSERLRRELEDSLRQAAAFKGQVRALMTDCLQEEAWSHDNPLGSEQITPNPAGHRLPASPAYASPQTGLTDTGYTRLVHIAQRAAASGYDRGAFAATVEEALGQKARRFIEPAWEEATRG